jgi:NADP-dependent 3-hydroxy acid dehydrogenase YdfG
VGRVNVVKDLTELTALVTGATARTGEATAVKLAKRRTGIARRRVVAV